MAELADVLSRPKFRLPLALQTDILDQVREDATLVYPTNDLPTASIDPDDNYVLQAALFVNANFHMTGDEKHLIPLQRIGDTEIIKPATFYERLVQ